MRRTDFSAVTLHQLRVFGVAARQQNFARAAEALSLSPPSISEQIQLLERSVGCRLLERSPGRRSVRLTEAGHMLLAAYDRVANALAEAEHALDSLNRMAHGTVTLAAGQYFGTFVFPRLHRAFRDAYPGIAVHLIVAPNHMLARHVHQGDVDLAVAVMSPNESAGLELIPFGGFDAVLVAPRSHRLAGRSSIPFGELASEQLILPERSVHYRAELDRLAKAAGVELSISIEVNNMEARLQAARAGLGVAAVGGFSHPGAADDLCVLPVEGTPIHLNWAILYRNEGLSRHAEELVKHLLSPPPAG